MKKRALKSLLLCLLSSLLTAQVKNSAPTFPTVADINSLMTQTERAMNFYESAIKIEEVELGKEAGARRDREVLNDVRTLLSKFKIDPGSFNSPFGFLLISDLDDASRNMAVCMSQGGIKIATERLNSTDLEASIRQLHLAQTCLDVSNLTYTVSESATALYRNYLLANALLQDKARISLEKCAVIINSKVVPRNPK